MNKKNKNNRQKQMKQAIDNSNNKFTVKINDYFNNMKIIKDFNDIRNTWENPRELESPMLFFKNERSVMSYVLIMISCVFFSSFLMMSYIPFNLSCNIGYAIFTISNFSAFFYHKLCLKNNAELFKQLRLFSLFTIGFIILEVCKSDLGFKLFLMFGTLSSMYYGLSKYPEIKKNTEDICKSQNS